MSTAASSLPPSSVVVTPSRAVSASVSSGTRGSSSRSRSHSHSHSSKKRSKFGAGKSDVSGVYLMQDTHQKALVTQHQNNATRCVVPETAAESAASSSSSSLSSSSVGRPDSSGSVHRRIPSSHRKSDYLSVSSGWLRRITKSASSGSSSTSSSLSSSSSSAVSSSASSLTGSVKGSDTSERMIVKSTVKPATISSRFAKGTGDSELSDSRSNSHSMSMSSTDIPVSRSHRSFDSSIPRQRPSTTIDSSSTTTITHPSSTLSGGGVSPMTADEIDDEACDPDLLDTIDEQTLVSRRMDDSSLFADEPSGLGSSSDSSAFHSPAHVSSSVLDIPFKTGSRSRLFGGLRGGRNKEGSPLGRGLKQIRDGIPKVSLRLTSPEAPSVRREEDTVDGSIESSSMAVTSAMSMTRSLTRKPSASRVIHRLVEKSRQKTTAMSRSAAAVSKSMVEMGSESMRDVMRKRLERNEEALLSKGEYPFLKDIPHKCADLWQSNVDNELNYFCKMTCHPKFRTIDPAYRDIDWSKRISTDIIRAGKLYVSGDIHEVFEFPKFKTTEEKLELVNTTLKYMQCAVADLILDRQLAEREQKEMEEEEEQERERQRRRQRMELGSESMSDADKKNDMKQEDGSEMISAEGSKTVCKEDGISADDAHDCDVADTTHLPGSSSSFSSSSLKPSKPGSSSPSSISSTSISSSSSSSSSSSVHQSSSSSASVPIVEPIMVPGPRPPPGVPAPPVPAPVEHYLDRDSIQALTEKIVRQTMISLCQDFVNDPYFMHLKQVCNLYNFQPVDLGLMHSKHDRQVLEKIEVEWKKRRLKLQRLRQRHRLKKAAAGGSGSRSQPHSPDYDGGDPDDSFSSADKLSHSQSDLSGTMFDEKVVAFDSWKPRLSIVVCGNEIKAMVCRMFRCLRIEGIEAVETSVFCGFKRTYVINILPKPMKIEPPVWLVCDSHTGFTYELTPDQWYVDPDYDDSPLLFTPSSVGSATPASGFA